MLYIGIYITKETLHEDYKTQYEELDTICAQLCFECLETCMFEEASVMSKPLSRHT